MKKSARILTLVLSLAIICGALAVASFASDETRIIGIMSDFSTDFTGGKSVGTANGTVVPEFTVNHKGSGVANVITNPYDENSYFSWSYEENVGTATGNFSHICPKPGHSWVDPTNGKEDLFKEYYWKNNDYYVVDLDVWFPKDVPGTGTRVYFFNYYVDQTVSGDKIVVGDSTESTNVIGWSFLNSPSGAPRMTTGSGESYAILDGAWNHLTAIIASEVVDNSVVLTCYTALNGTIVDKFTYTLDSAASNNSTNAYKGDWTLWYPKTLRVDFGGNDNNGNIMNLDNVSLRRITYDYNGNLADVLKGGVGTETSAWESDLYDADKMPFSRPVAYVGNTAYDHLQKAVDAAEAGSVITLAADVKSEVMIDKLITIECGEYEMAAPTTAPGLVYEYDEVANVYTTVTTQDVLYIIWEECPCGLDDCDQTHPGGVEAEGYLNNKLSQYYEAAGKSINWTKVVGPKTYTLAGWMDEEGNVYDLDATITQEMIDNVLLTLTPVIGVKSIPITYTKAGTTYHETDIYVAIANADDGSTIVFEDNVKLGKESTLNVTKNLTIDLNGYCFDLMTVKKFTGINIGAGKTFTVTSSRAGASLVRAYPTAVTKFGGTLFSSAGHGSTINLNNIIVSTAALYGNWSDFTVTLNIDNCYVNADGAGDNPAFVYHKGILTANIKNSIFKGSNANFGINNTNEGSVINAENSTFINNIVDGTYNNCVLNLKGCYVSGSIRARKINVDAGCYFTENTWATNASFATGVTLVGKKFETSHTNYTHPWIVNEVNSTFVWDNAASIVFTETVTERTYWFNTVKGIIVTFKDGETILGTATGEAGKKVIGPVAGTPESVADGWVLATKSYAYSIPTTATDDITVDIKDVTEFEYKYEAGAPEFYYNYRLTDNLATNLYAPKVLPEGIQITKTMLSSSADPRSWSGNYTIGGKEYQLTQAWPSAWNADDNSPIWTVTFTYAGATINYTVQPSVIDYAQKIVKIYSTDADKIAQATALLQYVEASNILKNQVPASALTALLADLKTKVTLPTVPEAVGNIDALKPYISGAKVTVNSLRGGALAFTLTDAGKAEGISFKFTAKGMDVGISNDGNKVCTDSSNLVTWGSSEITITVSDANGVLATGTYSLAAYNTAFASEATETELSLLQSIYALAYIGNTN